MDGSPMIPVFAPYFTGRELEYLTRAIQTGWISSAGPFLREFEEKMAADVGVTFAEACSSGTAALHLVLHALGIGPGDEVIVPSQTFYATTAAIAYTGATPVFADILEDTWTLDPTDCVRKLSPRTRVVIPVDLFGLCADVPALRAALAKAGRDDVFILEDAAEAYGSSLHGVRAGALGDAGIFSFYGNKTITAGEGGMVLTSRPDLAERVRFLKNHAMSATKRYFHPEVGFNYRMTNLQAAVGLAQLAGADELLARKRRIHARYRAALEGQKGIRLQAVPQGHAFLPWLTTVVDDALAGEEERDALLERLRRRGIDTRPMFYPNHLLPAFTKAPAAARGSLPVTERLSFRGFGLPSGAGLTDAEIDRVVETYLDERRHFA